MPKTELEQDLSYWHWFFCKEQGRPGLQVLFNWWSLLALVLGSGIAALVSKSMAEVSQQVLLPMIGVLVGLTFAWGGNAQALIQTEEIRLVTKQNQNGTRYFVGYYQTAILLILLSLAAWMFASFDVRIPYQRELLWIPRVLESLLYALTVMTFIECWSVVDTARKLLLARERVLIAKEVKAKAAEFERQKEREKES